jgi:hypothetical protein
LNRLPPIYSIPYIQLCNINNERKGYINIERERERERETDRRNEKLKNSMKKSGLK